MLRFLSALIALAAASGGIPAAAGGVGDDDVATVRQRMLEAFCWPSSWASSPAALAAGAADARKLAAALLPSNCTWADVDYSDSQDRTIWATAVHTQRVQLMAAALSFAGSPAYNDASLFDAARCALGAWFRGNFTNVNWWWTILETPQTIAASVLMLDVLPPAAGRAPFPSAAEAAAALNITLRAAWWEASLGYIVTGANLAWMIQAQLLRGAWPSLLNTSALDGGFARLWQEVKTVHWIPGCSIVGTCNGTNQGIQADTSWHFHGPQLQTAQYGQDYLNDELDFMAVANGTRFALDTQRAQVLCSYVSGGFAWASAGRGMDWSSAGRAMDRNSWFSEVTVNATTLRALAARCADPGERAVVLRFADVAAGKTTAATVQGHRHFWTSDWTSFKRPGWHATWRGLSNRTQPNECGNGENLLGMSEALGLLNVVAEGDGVCVESPNATAGAFSHGPLGFGCGLEYAGVFPLLDWNALNGATALVDLPEPPCGLSKQCCWTEALIETRRPFVGGVSDGVYGASAMDLDYLSLTAHKAVFFFDAAVVALGADVVESTGASRVRTALASRFLRADAARSGLVLGFANGTARTFAANSSATGVNESALELAWAFADGVGYVVLPGASGSMPSAAVWAGPREEPWSRIGCFPGNMSGNTLSLSIEQKQPDASYAYVVVPNSTSAIVARAAGDLGALGLDAAGLVNSRALQAAAQANASDAIVEVVFWDPGTYTFVSGDGPGSGAWSIAISVDAPCLLSYHETRAAGTDPGSDSTVVLAAASPDAVDLELHVSLPLRPGCAAVALGLNPSAQGEDFLGMSQVARLSCPPLPGCCTAAE
jgi:chondroitin AC lyase